MLIPFVVLTAFQNIIGGGRGYILWLVCVGFTTSYVINMKKYRWRKHISFKYIKVGTIVLIVVFVGFYLLKYIVRIGNTVNSILDYIGYYAGGSLQNFNLYLSDPPSSTHQIWGKETFMGIYSTLEKYGLVDLTGVYATNSNLEFRKSKGVSIGNVYGAVRRYYNDFGILGVITLQMICSTFFNAFYYKLKKLPDSHSKFVYLFYAYLLYHVYEMPIDDTFYKNFISFNMFTTFIVLYLVYYLFANVRFISFTKIGFKTKELV
jgi:oligosaccharide repeat unit polymerase